MAHMKYESIEKGKKPPTKTKGSSLKDLDLRSNMFIYSGYNNTAKNSLEHTQSVANHNQSSSFRNEKNFFKNCNNTYLIQKQIKPTIKSSAKEQSGTHRQKKNNPSPARKNRPNYKSVVVSSQSTDNRKRSMGKGMEFNDTSKIDPACFSKKHKKNSVLI